MSQRYSKQSDKKPKDFRMNMQSLDGLDGNLLPNKHGITSLESKSNSQAQINSWVTEL